MDPIPEKKRRGRKAKNITILTTDISNNVSIPIEKPPPKKRGRKPKGGKVLTSIPVSEDIPETKINIILHLKCGLNDLDQNLNNHTKSDAVENYKFPESKLNDLNFMQLNSIPEPTQSELSNKNLNDTNKTICQKLEKLSNNLHINNICDKKSACFHCTCDFDNVPIYIPKYELNNLFYVYGCFCSPECACAFLMNEKNLDTTTKFERYQLLNFLYCKIYNYSKNIKPAPSPFYMLDKYYGDLSIQEYRKLLKNERLLLIVDKPLIRVLPELHEDTDDYLLNYQGIPSSSSTKYNLQRQKTLSKNDIVNEQFNLGAE